MIAMPTMIHGTKVVLYEKTKVGADAFNHPIYEETPVEIENVLIQPVAPGNSILTQEDLKTGTTLINIGIPKGDNHDWRNAKLEAIGHTWKTYGLVVEGIEENIPLDWHKQVSAVRYE